jgi:hypothetical protein
VLILAKAFCPDLASLKNILLTLDVDKSMARTQELEDVPT